MPSVIQTGIVAKRGPDGKFLPATPIYNQSDEDDIDLKAYDFFMDIIKEHISDIDF